LSFLGIIAAYMSKNNIILYIGVALFLIPFLGFPSNWENFINIAFGVILVGLSFSIAIKRRSSIPKGRRRRKTDTASLFVDGAGNAPVDVAPVLASSSLASPLGGIDTSL